MQGGAQGSSPDSVRFTMGSPGQKRHGVRTRTAAQPGSPPQQTFRPSASTSAWAFSEIDSNQQPLRRRFELDEAETSTNCAANAAGDSKRKVGTPRKTIDSTTAQPQQQQGSSANANHASGSDGGAAAATAFGAAPAWADAFKGIQAGASHTMSPGFPAFGQTAAGGPAAQSHAGPQAAARAQAAGAVGATGAAGAAGGGGSWAAFMQGLQGAGAYISPGAAAFGARGGHGVRRGARGSAARRGPGRFAPQPQAAAQTQAAGQSTIATAAAPFAPPAAAAAHTAAPFAAPAAAAAPFAAPPFGAAAAPAPAPIPSMTPASAVMADATGFASSAAPSSTRSDEPDSTPLAKRLFATPSTGGSSGYGAGEASPMPFGGFKFSMGADAAGATPNITGRQSTRRRGHYHAASTPSGPRPMNASPYTPAVPFAGFDSAGAANAATATTSPGATSVADAAAVPLPGDAAPSFAAPTATAAAVPLPGTGAPGFASPTAAAAAVPLPGNIAPSFAAPPSSGSPGFTFGAAGAAQAHAPQTPGMQYSPMAWSPMDAAAATAAQQQAQPQQAQPLQPLQPQPVQPQQAQPQEQPMQQQAAAPAAAAAFWAAAPAPFQFGAAPQTSETAAPAQHKAPAASAAAASGVAFNEQEVAALSELMQQMGTGQLGGTSTSSSAAHEQLRHVLSAMSQDPAEAARVKAMLQQQQAERQGAQQQQQQQQRHEVEQLGKRLQQERFMGSERAPGAALLEVLRKRMTGLNIAASTAPNAPALAALQNEPPARGPAPAAAGAAPFAPAMSAASQPNLMAGFTAHPAAPQPPQPQQQQQQQQQQPSFSFGTAPTAAPAARAAQPAQAAAAAPNFTMGSAKPAAPAPTAAPAATATAHAATQPAAPAPLSFTIGSTRPAAPAPTVAPAAAAAPQPAAAAQAPPAPPTFSMGAPAATAAPVSARSRGKPSARRAGLTPAKKQAPKAQGAAATAAPAAPPPAQPTSAFAPPGGWPEVPPVRPTAATQPAANGSTIPSGSSAFRSALGFGSARQAPQQQQQQQQGADVSSHDPQAQAVSQARVRAAMYRDRAISSYKAEDYETAEQEFGQAIQELRAACPRDEGLPPLLGNRAGARLMLHRPHAALSDALAAIRTSAKFVRGYTRAATCHVRLGELTAARAILDKIIDMSSSGNSQWRELLERRAAVEKLLAHEASLAAALGGDVGANRAFGAPLPKDRVGEVAAAAKELGKEAPYSERLAALRAAVLLLCGDLDAAAAACLRHRCDAPAQNGSVAGMAGAGGSGSKQEWRWWVQAQVAFHKGDVNEALSKLHEGKATLSAAATKAAEQQADANAVNGFDAVAGASSTVLQLPGLEQVASLCEQLQSLLLLKEAGNSQVRAGAHAAAVDQYTAALAKGGPPRFAAVLHCNRAAAHLALGRHNEALADCTKARALDPGYAKAYSRLAQLLSEVRRPDAAAQVLQQLLSTEASDDTGAGGGLAAGLDAAAAAAYKERLSAAKRAARWQKTPDHYKLLGVAKNASEEEVRKAFKKMALRHHPDKALASVKIVLLLGEEAGCAVAAASDFEARLRQEANFVFNLINAAHEELGDKVKRRKVDQLLDAEQDPSSLFNDYMGSSMYSAPSYTSYNDYYRPQQQEHYQYQAPPMHRRGPAAQPRQYQQQQRAEPTEPPLHKRGPARYGQQQTYQDPRARWWEQRSSSYGQRKQQQQEDSDDEDQDGFQFY